MNIRTLIAASLLAFSVGCSEGAAEAGATGAARSEADASSTTASALGSQTPARTTEADTTPQDQPNENCVQVFEVGQPVEVAAGRDYSTWTRAVVEAVDSPGDRFPSYSVRFQNGDKGRHHCKSVHWVTARSNPSTRTASRSQPGSGRTPPAASNEMQPGLYFCSNWTATYSGVGPVLTYGTTVLQETRVYKGGGYGFPANQGRYRLGPPGPRKGYKGVEQEVQWLSGLYREQGATGHYITGDGKPRFVVENFRGTWHSCELTNR